MTEHDVMIYALTSCGWCRKTKAWFEEERIPYKHADVDALDGEEAKAMAAEVERLSGGRRFPVVVIDGHVVVGYQPQKYAEHLGRTHAANEG
ncbi:MAG: glutaredoxin family protein [Thermoleophilia bacterium]